MDYDRRAADTSLTLKGVDAKKYAKDARALRDLVDNMNVNLAVKLRSLDAQRQQEVGAAVDDLEEASRALIMAMQLLERAGKSLEKAGSTR